MQKSQKFSRAILVVVLPLVRYKKTIYKLSGDFAISLKIDGCVKCYNIVYMICLEYMQTVVRYDELKF